MGSGKRGLKLIASARANVRLPNPERLREPVPAVRRCEGPGCSVELRPRGGKTLRAWTRFCSDACRLAAWHARPQPAKAHGAGS